MTPLRWTYHARLPSLGKAHYDGDTVRLELDTGFSHFAVQRLRLVDVWAPERGQPGSEECSAYVLKWLTDQAREGGAWPFVVETFRTSGDNDKVTLGRYLAEVWSFTGQSLNDAVSELVEAHPEWSRGTGGDRA